MAGGIRMNIPAALVLIGACGMSGAKGQTPSESPSKVSQFYPTLTLPVSSTLVPEPQTVSTTSSVGSYGVSALTPDPLLTPEPYRLERYGEAPGWYSAVDIGLLKPHITNRVSSGGPIGAGFAEPVRAPVASLDWTVSPRFEIGRRLAGGNGDVRLGYRLLATSGDERGLDQMTTSRFHLNVIDLNYVSGEWLTEDVLSPLRTLRFSLGVRLATSFLDSTLTEDATTNKFASHYVGAGPVFGAEWSKSLCQRPIELFTRFETAGLVGQTRQSFAATSRDQAGELFGAARRDRGVKTAVGVVSAEGGLAWRPAWVPGSRVAVGYHFQQWWGLGRTDDSNYDLTVQGAFFRAEFRY